MLLGIDFRSSKTSITSSRRPLVRFLSAQLLYMHRRIVVSTSYLSTSPYLIADDLPGTVPPLDSPKILLRPTTRMASEMVASCSLCSPTSASCSMSCSRNTSAIFYMIITPTLLDRHEVHVTRQTLAKLTVSASICHSTQALKITLPSTSSLTHRPTTYEISSLLPRIILAIRFPCTLILQPPFPPRA
ncbi:hypothetical protein M405DRAFT_353146 [Rhizopogon salebrosus TDB-379]|nr:hypothetical protein M405DRAFT_353146 [Rhizopogon salebrosus TDB-379]